jgi:hypothetical protein
VAAQVVASRVVLSSTESVSFTPLNDTSTGTLPRPQGDPLSRPEAPGLRYRYWSDYENVFGVSTDQTAYEVRAYTDHTPDLPRGWSAS